MLYARSTLGSFLRAFTFGHVRQLDAVASRVLTALGSHTALLSAPADQLVVVDVDDTIIEVHGHAKQGASFGYSRVRGLNALLATFCTDSSAPVVVAQRLRNGSTGSPRGAARRVADALKTVTALTGHGSRKPLLRPTRRPTGGPPTAPRSVSAPTCRSPSGWIPRSRGLSLRSR